MRRETLICAVLALLTFAVYSPVMHHDFINYDDPDYVTENFHVLKGLTKADLAWAFTTGHAANWHPMTWLSHMLDCEIFGLKAGPHHLTNLLFHITNSLLLFGVLRQMTRDVWPSALVAALFAWHPLHVESVAWVAERKDVLSAFFWLLSMGAYSRYARKPKLHAYLLVLLFFVLGLLSKPMVVTLPCVLVLMDYWPLRRVGAPNEIKLLNSKLFLWQHSILEKLPLFFLALCSSLVTFAVQRTGGAVNSLTRLPFGERVANVCVAYVRYLAKTILPTELCIFYPHPHAWPGLQVLASAAFIIIITVGTLLYFRKRPVLAIGWLWFLGTLVPVIGLIQVGAQSMADRYTYLPSIGIFIMLAWGIHGATLPGRQWIYRGSVFALCTACLLLTSKQLQYWKDSVTLFEHALKVTTNNTVAYVNAGSALAARGKIDDGLVFLKKAIELNPKDAGAHCQLAESLANQGKLKPAITEYREALRLNPNLLAALNNYGWLLATAPAEQDRNGPEAVKLLERACELSRFERPLIIGSLAAAYAEAGRYAEAVTTANRARILALSLGQNDLAEANQKLLDQYQSNQAFHQAL
jgi:Tfp pilus assembly protein PilF